ncbi:hypothetical protein SPSIL_058340 [Sporomusa silvacetica DSM 10669]|uniref:Phage minor structural protein GP20 n=1 Tax=Sporomusa silvacetica DSM 10669 TaxID=1123289 RepID=A0ABZ3IVL5_9FIRM|nr:hypothetical protein [Sporomusa silvacetica]OZC14218.1 hypothetical protein SPSIL_49450 [Sporomusa silvacetica DSM 10669]
MKSKYYTEKQTILNDRMLSDEGKQLKIQELQNQYRDDLASEKDINNIHLSGVRSQINEIKKTKYKRPLPTSNIPNKEYLANADLSIATLLAQSVALMAEQRAESKLLAKLAMAENAETYLAVVDDAIYENPSAVVSAFSEVKKGLEGFNVNGVKTRITELYSKAIDAEMEPKERKWNEANSLKLKELQKRETELFMESITINRDLEDVINDGKITKGENYYFGGGQEKENSQDPYFKNPVQKVE